VQLVESVDEAAVVACFLEGELASPRFRDQIVAAAEALGADEAALLAPGADDLRRRVLRAFRGDYLARLFVDPIDWYRALLAPDEVLAIRYIDWDFWLELSGGTRSPLEAARRIRSDGRPWEEPRLDGPPLIVVRPDPASPLVVVEGHVRLTAFAVHPQHLPPGLEVLLGEGSAAAGW
jgi:hypothetical protein